MHLAKDPSTRATVRQLSRSLAFAPAIVELWVEDLARKGLVDVDDGGICYSPSDVALARMVDRLAHAYRTRRVAVVARIVAERDDDEEDMTSRKAEGDRRDHPGRALSDAFKLRKGDPK